MSAASTIALTELERDALAELVNLGVSQAAHSLAQMVHEEVLLTVPKVDIVTREQAILTLADRANKELIAVHQQFDGDLTGRALLIFPEENSLELVRAIVGHEASLEEIIELEQEALAETGNIILNGCLATIANQLQRSFRISLPEILHGVSAQLFSLPRTGDVSTVLFIYINFRVRRREIEGYIAMMMDMPSLAILQQLLAEFIRRTAGEVDGRPAGALGAAGE